MKTIVIGVDGADPLYIEKGIQQGKLNTFKQLREKGAYGNLKSSIPPLSLPAWTCFYTGKNPGKLGIFNFVEVKRNYSFELVNWKVETPIWKILSKNGLKVAIINNYFTYPPDKVNGVMICAIDNISKNCYYPTNLKNEIEKALGKLDFGIIPSYYAIPKKELTRLTDIMLRSNVELIKYIIKNYDFDFLLTTLDVDRIHHLISNEVEIINWYEKIDHLINEILRCFKEPINILLLSDHGGGPTKKEFYINTFLMKKGFLHLKKKYKKNYHKLLVKMGFNMENLLNLIQSTKLDHILVKILPSRIWDIAKEKVPRKKTSFFDADIDWSNTRAFAPHPSVGAIQINLKGREEKGIVEPRDYEALRNEIISSLKDFCDSYSIPLDIYKKEEIYYGPFLDKAPDIIFIMDDYRYFPKIEFYEQIFSPPRDPGHHRTSGFFIFSGPHIKKKQLNAEIIDLMPTILKIFKINPPKDVDGRVLNIFKNG